MNNLLSTSVHSDFLFPAAKANPNIAGTTAASCGLWAGHEGSRAPGRPWVGLRIPGCSCKAVPRLLMGGPFHIRGFVVETAWVQFWDCGVDAVWASTGPSRFRRTCPRVQSDSGAQTAPQDTDQSEITGKGRTHDRDEGTASVPLTPASSAGSGELEP